MVVERAGWVAAPTEQVWEIVRRAEELPYWLAGVRRAEASGPPTFGRVQRTFGSRSGTGVDVEAAVIAYREPTLIAWRTVTRRTAGGPWLPARPDELHVQLTPEAGRTLVHLYAVRPASPVVGVLLQAKAGWRIRDHLTRSLDALAAHATCAARSG